MKPTNINIFVLAALATFMLVVFAVVGFVVLYQEKEPESSDVSTTSMLITPPPGVLSPAPATTPALYSAVMAADTGAVAEILMLISHPAMNREEYVFQYIEADEVVAYSRDKIKTFEQLLNNALFLAAREGHSDIIALLLNAGADPNLWNLHYNYPLLAAARNNHYDCVRLLLDGGAFINEWDVLSMFSSSALHHAVGENNIEIVRLLIERGADVNQQARQHASPLVIASIHGHMEMVRLLVENGATVRYGKEDLIIENSLYHAVDEGYYDIARYLLEHGADVNQKGRFWSYTPLHLAAMDGDIRFVKLLLLYQADVSGAPDEECPEPGPCPLDLAVRYQHREVIRILIQHGADMNNSCQEGWTPLQNASAGGDEELVKMLIDFGADVNWTGIYSSETPLDLALKNRHDLLCEYLRKQGAKTGSEIWHGQ